jgi:phosphoglycerol transferase MdoB-like AlkP superfamily enzyme
MKYFFQHNGYEVLDRADFSNEEKTFGNIWGLSDEDLFNKSIKIANDKSKEKDPFFLFLLTTSNHRPYSFPEGKIDMPSGTRSAAVKYTDYAINKFIEDSKKESWFDNTIFIIVADHCATAAGRVDLPKNNYHIPLFIYAPKLIEPKKIDILSGQIDVAPTILGLMNMNYTSEFFGQDILDKNFKPKAFISTYQLLGFLKEDDLVILEPNKKLLDMNENIMEAISFYQISSKLFNDKQKANSLNVQ